MPIARSLRSASTVLAAGILTLASGRARADEKSLTGLYVEASSALSLHKDSVGLRGTQAQDGYSDLSISLRLGAAIRGVLVGASVEGAAMIETPGATYASVFLGSGVPLPNAMRLELTGEFGLHGFENVGASGDKDVTSENHVTLPFWGARVTFTQARATSPWQGGLFAQVRHDLGHGEVTSNRTTFCSSGIADAYDCEPGATSTGYFDVGGLSVEGGVELRRIF